MDAVTLSPYATLLRFFVYNGNRESKYAGISVSCDINFNSRDDAPVYALSSGLGFQIVGSSHYLYFAFGNEFATTDVFRYWFGNLGSVSSNYWTQTSSYSYSGGDSGMAFSWDPILIAPGTTECRAVLVTFDYFDLYTLSQSLMVDPFPDPVFIGDVITVSGYVYASGYTIAINFWVIVDANASTITPLGVSGYTESYCEFSFALSDCPISMGAHDLGIYAVDRYGDVSPPFTISVTLVSAGGGGAADENAQGTWVASFSNPTAMAIGVTIAVTVVILIIVVLIAIRLRRRVASDSASA
jgi:hypothetical protein